MDKEILTKLMKRSATQKERLLYLFLQEEVVNEEKAYLNGINHFKEKIKQLRMRGWVIQNIKPFTYRLIND